MQATLVLYLKERKCKQHSFIFKRKKMQATLAYI